MSLSEMVGKLCAGSRSWENRLAAMGRRWPNSPFIRRWCDAAAEQILLREPAAVRPAFTSFGVYVSVRLDQTIGREIYFHGVYEPEVTRILQQIAKAGQCWLDVSSGNGYFAMLLAKCVGDSGKVIAFESSAESVDRLKSSMVLNGVTNVTLLPMESFSDEQIEKFKPDGIRIESAGAIQLAGQLRTLGYEQTAMGTHVLFIHKPAAITQPQLTTNH